MVSRPQAVVLLGAIALFGVRLGSYDLWLPDEPRYAEIAEELRSLPHGAADLVLLRLNGDAYTQKPPLYFWLAALAGAPGARVDEWAARLPSALAGVATVALTMRLGALLLGAESGTLGAALLLTTFAFAFAARSAGLDVLLVLFETLAIAMFARVDRAARARRRDLAALHGSLALALLTKGPVGWIVPALVIAAFLAWERRLASLRRVFPLWGLALAFAPALVWLTAAAALAPAGWLDAALLDNLVGRFVSGTSHARPIYYEIEKLPAQLLPWAPLLLLVGWAAPRSLASHADGERRRAWRLLVAWVVTTLVFFSLSAGKRPRYLMTSFPAYALLMADATRAGLACVRRPARALALGLAPFAAGTVAFAIWLVRRDLFGDGRLSLAFATAALALGTASAIAWLALARAGAGAGARLAVPIGAALIGLGVAHTVAVPALYAPRSPRRVAAAAGALAAAGEPIGVLGDRALGEGIAYYGGRRGVLLETPESVSDFAASGGRVLVLAEGRLSAVEAVAAVRVRERIALDNDWLLVATLGGPLADGAPQLP